MDVPLIWGAAPGTLLLDLPRSPDSRSLIALGLLLSIAAPASIISGVSLGPPEVELVLLPARNLFATFATSSGVQPVLFNQVMMLPTSTPAVVLTPT